MFILVIDGTGGVRPGQNQKDLQKDQKFDQPVTAPKTTDTDTFQKANPITPAMRQLAEKKELEGNISFGQKAANELGRPNQ